MKKIIICILTTLNLMSIITPVYANEFNNVVSQSEKSFLANIEKDGSYGLSLNVPSNAFGYFGQCDLDFDSDGQIEHLCLNLRKENKNQAIYAELYEDNLKVDEFPMLIWEISPYLINKIDISVIYIYSKPIIFVEDNYYGTMASGAGLNFMSIYYENQMFHEYYSFEWIGSYEDDENFSRFINEFRNKGFGIAGLKVFDYDNDWDTITHQLNGTSICNLYISCTSSEPSILGNLLNNPVPFIYTMYTNLNAFTRSVKVILNGAELSFDQPPILDPAGRVLVPIRKIAEAMGDDVKWSQDLQTAFVEHKERALIIPLYTDHLYIAYSDKPVEWRKYDLDVPSQNQNERTLTPVRAFCESLGATVNWDDSTQTVYIEYNGNYEYDSLSDETINGINMAYSIMREHNNISFEKYSEEIYAYLENSNNAVDNVAMSWGSDLFDGIVHLLSGEDATETAVKASLAQVISLLDDINRTDDNAEVINGLKFTKSGAEAVKAFSELPEENLRINNIDDLNKLSETVPELESLSKAIKATGIAVDVLTFSAEQSSYLLADYAQNIAYLDNIEKYFRATSAGDDLLYKVIDDMREEYSSKWIHSLKSLRNEGIDKVLSALVDKATFGVFGIVNFAKDLTNELTGLSTSAKGLKEFYASCILNVAFNEAYYDMMEDVSGIHFHSDEMIDMFNMQRAVKATTYMSMNKIANSVDEVSWDDRIDELEDASYILWE